MNNVKIVLIREKKEALKEAGIIENESDLDSIELVNLEDFNQKGLTKEKRSNTKLNNSLIKETLGIELSDVSDREFLSKIIDDYITNMKNVFFIKHEYFSHRWFWFYR